MTDAKRTASADSPVRVLLIEDNSGDARLVEEYLRRPYGRPVRLTTASRFAEGVAMLPGADVALIDLNLPDSQGLETVSRLVQVAPRLPIVVMTGMADEELGEKSLAVGAQDYLVKGEVTAPLLMRALRYAIERARLQWQVTQAEAQLERDRELANLERLVRQSPATITAEVYGIRPLRDFDPALFRELADRYGQLLERAVERQLYRVEHDVSADLHDLAERLGFLGAGPRDVVDLHAFVMRSKAAAHVTSVTGAYAEEGRLMVLELMGYIAAYYRSHCYVTRGRQGREQ